LYRVWSDLTGNILSLENFDYVVDKYGGKMDIITADGFDFSIDFDNQEIMTALLFAQVSYGLCIQKKNGTFIKYLTRFSIIP
jgi:hypothetical protein